MAGESTSSPRRINAKLRARQALDLRIAGVTFQVIKDTLKYNSVQAAWDAVRRELAAIPKAEAAHLRGLEVERLDKLLFAVWPRALQRDHEAINSALRILAQRARLLGLEVKEPAPGSSRDHPLWTQAAEAVDLSAATDTELDEIIEKARAIQEAGRLAAGEPAP